MVQVLYLLEVFILAHYYGPLSTEIPTTERNHNSGGAIKTVEFL